MRIDTPRPARSHAEILADYAKATTRHFHDWQLVAMFGKPPRRECDCGAVESVSLSRQAQMLRITP